MNVAYWLNTAWMMKCRSEASAFERAAGRVAQTQSDLLLEMLRRNASTEFGRDHGFDRIATPQEYQRRVPLASYEDFAERIDLIAESDVDWLRRRAVATVLQTGARARVACSRC